MMSKLESGPGLRQQNQIFLKEIADYREPLYRYCRHLCGDPFHAEELVQETLMKAWARLSDTHFGIANGKAYLFRIATNQWTDWCRRSKRVSLWDDAKDESQIPDDTWGLNESQMDVAGALSEAMGFLPPRECAALVLKEALGCSLRDIAEILSSTENAVKAALHRARRKIDRQRDERQTVTEETSPLPLKKPISEAEKALVQRAVEAFNNRDLQAMGACFLETATGNAFGCFLENSREEILKGSLFHTLLLHDGSPQPAQFRAEARELWGQLLFLIWDGSKLDDVWRFESDEDHFRHFDSYYCCPYPLREVALELGVEAHDHGHYYEENMGS